MIQYSKDNDQLKPKREDLWIIVFHKRSRYYQKFTDWKLKLKFGFVMKKFNV